MAVTTARFRAGDRVKVRTREATSQDLKSGLFFNHFSGLVGHVQKIYGDGQVAVAVELDALPEEIWKRHMQTRDQMRERWLEGLSDDVRRKLTPEQKQFDLRYVILVGMADLERRRAGRS